MTWFDPYCFTLQFTLLLVADTSECLFLRLMKWKWGEESCHSLILVLKGFKNTQETTG
jgi:hypothetical protein